MSASCNPPHAIDKLDLGEVCSQATLHVVPLGGLGEFGLNMTAYCYNGDVVIVDCGGMFPDHSLLGIDLVIPDFSLLRPHAQHIRALVLTHGHEDHIGATPYFLRDIPVPVYGSPFTLALVKNKLDEHDIRLPKDYLRPLSSGDRVKLGTFTLNAFHVTHSISQAISLGIECPEGNLVHTGDFRIDPTPSDGNLFDYEGFACMGRRGVLALMSDSTNVERPGQTRSEREVAIHLDRLIDDAEGRMFITLFSSAIPRIREVLAIARRRGRKVHIAGKSLMTSIHIARDMKILDEPDSLFIPVEQVDALPPRQVMVLMTGSQGEPRSVLTRVAMNDHRELKIRPGDSVILSSRIIPGHERSVANVVNNLTMHGATVYTEQNAIVHTSGHGHSGELLTMLNLTRPHHFVPIHGEYRQLHLHRQLAVQTGVPQANTHLILNGEVLEFSDGQARVIGQIPVGRVFVDGNGVGEVTPEEVSERRKIGNAGVVIGILVVRRSTGEILFGPELISRGFLFDEGSETLFEEAKTSIAKTVESFSRGVRGDLEEMKEEFRLAIRRFFNRALERKPVVIPIVMEM
jgi:ribonuclease J